MSLKLYEILCPDGYVKNGYDKSKLSTIFANSMNSSKTPNTDFTHIDNSKSEKISIFDIRILKQLSHGRSKICIRR